MAARGCSGRVSVRRTRLAGTLGEVRASKRLRRSQQRECVANRSSPRLWAVYPCRVSDCATD